MCAMGMAGIVTHVVIISSAVINVALCYSSRFVKDKKIVSAVSDPSPDVVIGAMLQNESTFFGKIDLVDIPHERDSHIAPFGSGACTFNPLFLEGTCSVHYTDPAASLIERVFLSLAEADCELANPCNYPPHYNPRDWEEFDFIVVGAGSAGSVVANRLTEITGWTVLLLEAGGDPPKTSEVPNMFESLQKTDVDWQYKTDPGELNCLGLEGNQCNWPRGKMLGGCSSNNYLTYIRGNPKDYDGWEAEGNVGLGYRDILQYFKKSEDMRSPEVKYTPDFLKYHGTGGPLKVEDFNLKYYEPLSKVIADGVAEMGYFYNPDCNGKYQSGFFKQQGTLQNGRRCSTAKAFLTPIRFRNNIKVSKNSLVSKILVDRITKGAYGVEYIDNIGNIIRVLARKEVVISAGSINSPQLLMLSGIGPKNHLRELGIQVIADLPVGKNLHDHPMSFGLYLTLDYSVPQAEDEQNMFNFLLKYNNTYSSIGTQTLFLFTNTEDPSIDYPNVQNSFVSFPKKSLKLSELLDKIGFKAEIKQQYIDKNLDSFTLLLLPILINPFSRGYIRLHSTNPSVHPKIISGYLSDPRDVKVLTQALNIYRNHANTEPLKAAGAKLYQICLDSCNRFLFDSPPYWDCFFRHLATTTYHPVGTCRMGPPGHPQAVVDPQLRVQGVGRLRVIDASVMPRVTRGNTNAPTIMIAEKGSDLIKKTWLSTPYSGIEGFRTALRYPWSSYGS